MNLTKIVMFGAPWCAPCRSLKPLATKECADAGIKYEYVNIEEQPERAMMAGVQSVPTVVGYGDGGDGGNVVANYGPPQCTPVKLKKLIRGEA